MGKIGLDAAAKSDASLKTTVQQVTSNGDMVQKLSTDEYGLGYFSHDSIDNAKSLGVKVLNFENVEPTEKNILSGSYLLARNFNYCIAQETDAVKKTIVEGFVAYMGTSEGMTTIKANGGIVDIKTTTPSWSTVKANFANIEADHKSVTINFGGSTSVENIAKALSADFSKRAGNFVASHNHTGSGDAYASTQGAKKGTLDIAFASREFKLTDSEPLAAGTYGKVCIDGIVVGVSDKNPLTNITAAQCKSIYDKANTTVSKWSDIIA
jgi:phosphate transport system substrate-binding protein